ncbi:MAG: hypothetical protein KGN16_01105 [Burkholderiales bacterium]|nr:hypothetical protein [Burkholderiales bacterium]
MATNLERRVVALESQRSIDKPAAEMTDRELLAIAVPEYKGPMPPDDELVAMLEKCLGRSIPTAPAQLLFKGGANGDS